MVEVMDCNCTGSRRLAKVTGLIGDRVHITYVKNAGYDEGKGRLVNLIITSIISQYHRVSSSIYF